MPRVQFLAKIVQMINFCAGVLLNLSKTRIFAHYMTTRKGHTRFKAYSLLALLAMAISLQLLHAVVEHGHEHAHDAPSCRAHEERGKHLHDERYAHHDCQLCAFCLSACGILVAPAFPAAILRFTTRLQFPPAQCCAASTFDTTCLRGPPATAANFRFA